MRPDDDEYLGVDVGSARVGVARGSGRARLAEPLQSIPSESAIEIIAGLAGRNYTGGIVIGLPRGLDGQETGQTRAVRQWAEQTKKITGLPCYWQDEALTSQAAGKLQKSNQKSQAADEHALAAAIILQDFLDTPVKDRIRA